MNNFLRSIFKPTHVLAFMLGILAAYFIYLFRAVYSHPSLNPEISLGIDPLQIISIFITVILAVYVLRELGHKDEGEKVERELLIKYINTFETELTKIIRDVAKDGVTLDYVVAVLKRYGMRLQSLLRLAEEQEFITANSSCKTELPENLKSIKDLLTDTPKTGEIENGVRVVDGKLSFSKNQVDRIAESLYATNSSIFRLVVEINRCRREVSR